MNNLNDNNGFKPYVPADRKIPEFTVKAVILGIFLGIVFGAANAYLGLKVGMTVSASIPVAVISMGILRGILRRGTVLENNMVQTIGSAGESLAAGVIFTIPALKSIPTPRLGFNAFKRPPVPHPSSSTANPSGTKNRKYLSWSS